MLHASLTLTRLDAHEAARYLIGVRSYIFDSHLALFILNYKIQIGRYPCFNFKQCIPGVI